MNCLSQAVTDGPHGHHLREGEIPPTGSGGSERTPSLSRLLLREEPEGAWIRSSSQPRSAARV